MNENTVRLKRVRIFLGVLILIPLALFADGYLFHMLSDSIRKLGLLILGVPILALNYWAWFFPEIVDNYLGRKNK